MMSLQARESFQPVVGHHHPLRVYAVDSPRAKARLIVLALLADGHLDESEIKTLDRRGVFSDLGISREDFVHVLYDFCDDVASHLSVGQFGYRLTQNAITGLLDEVADRDDREKLLKHIVAVISSDGCLSDREERLLKSAIDHWSPPIGKVSRTSHPELHYG